MEELKELFKDVLIIRNITTTEVHIEILTESQIAPQVLFNFATELYNSGFKHLTVKSI